MKKLNIFVLAAGLGERLRPITDHIPKPLLPVIGKPALQHVIDNVTTLPFNKVGINLHHKKEDIEAWYESSSLKEKITFFDEEIILDTGGALKNAEGFLKDSPFIVHNSDVLSDINLNEVYKYHCSSGNLVTLAVHDYPKFNSLNIDQKGLLRDVRRTGGRSSGSNRLLAFTGIAIYEAEFLEFLPDGISSVVDAWLDALKAGKKVGTFNVSGCYWSDIGTPSAYASAVFDALKADGENVYVHPSINTCENLEIHGFVVIEGDCVLGKDVSLRNCILLPGSRAGESDESSLHENCIIGNDYIVDFDEAAVTGVSADDGRCLIGTGGSDRKYYRINEGSKSSVLMQCREDDTDFERHMEYTKYFRKLSVPVPELINEWSDKWQAEFEDAGDVSLYSYLNCPREGAELEKIYRTVLDALVLIHTRAAENIGECMLLKDRTFDYDHFRWETEYFSECYLRDIRQMGVANRTDLGNEFHLLALKADSFPKTVIHRDFQSQNIMVIKGQEIKIIDFQGARQGPPAYDIASLLWDPYVRLEESIRNNLLDYYTDKMDEMTAEGFNRKGFMESIVPCRLQRHMQALGAYGFLSRVKGKKYFLKYIPEGLRLLKEDILPAKDEYPGLYKLINSL
ncbi:MAG: phosphotransferase [Nitrospirota bacterium]